MFTGIMNSKIIWSCVTQQSVTTCVQNTILSPFIDFMWLLLQLFGHLDVRSLPILKFLHKLATLILKTT